MKALVFEDKGEQKVVDLSEKEDVMMGVSSLGPHRADLMIQLDSRNTKENLEFIKKRN